MRRVQRRYWWLGQPQGQRHARRGEMADEWGGLTPLWRLRDVGSATGVDRVPSLWT